MTTKPDTILSRRTLLKSTFSVMAAGFIFRALAPHLAHAAEVPSGKTLIAFFSRTGNTRMVAEQIQRGTGGDLFELRTTHTYPEDYNATTRQARREQDSSFRPKLTATVPNMDAYTTVFIGYPNWWGTLPMAGFSFLEAYNFAGKRLIPFCTHEGSGLGRGPADIARLCPKSTIAEGLAMRGGRAASGEDAAQADVDAWLKRLGNFI